MLVNLFRSNQPAALFILPLVAVLLWLPAFLRPVPVEVAHAMPLYELCCGWAADLPYAAAFIGILLVLAGAFLLNFIVSEHEILARQTYLPALFYVVLMSCTMPLLSLHPVLPANIFLLIALHRLLTTCRRDTAFGEVFDAGFFVAVAALFYFPALVFFPLVWVGLGVLRPFIWREWLISLVGLIVPFLFALTYYFWFDMIEYFWEDKIRYPVMNRYFQFEASRPFMALLAVLLLLFLLSSGALISGIRTSKLKARSSLLLLVWFSFFSAVSMLLAPSVSFTYYVFLAVPLAVFYANYFLYLKRLWWAELLLWLLLGTIVFNHGVAFIAS